MLSSFAKLTVTQWQSFSFTKAFHTFAKGECSRGHLNSYIFTTYKNIFSLPRTCLYVCLSLPFLFWSRMFQSKAVHRNLTHDWIKPRLALNNIKSNASFSLRKYFSLWICKRFSDWVWSLLTQPLGLFPERFSDSPTSVLYVVLCSLVRGSVTLNVNIIILKITKYSSVVIGKRCNLSIWTLRGWVNVYLVCSLSRIVENSR